jgi:hypothetical protein
MTEIQNDTNEDLHVLDNGYDHLMILELEDDCGRFRLTVRQSESNALWKKHEARGAEWSDFDHACACECEYMQKANAEFEKILAQAKCTIVGPGTRPAPMKRPAPKRLI